MCTALVLADFVIRLIARLLAKRKKEVMLELIRDLLEVSDMSCFT
jgi:hypothetical protein